MRKTYYYKMDSKKPQKNGGYLVEASVYASKAGKIVRLGNVKWNTSASKGELSEVYELLKTKKLVTAKEFKDNDGYYRSKSKVDIRGL